jgi:hypothetical protein
MRFRRRNRNDDDKRTAHTRDTGTRYSVSACTTEEENPPVTPNIPGVRHLPNFLTHGDAQLNPLMRPYAPGTNHMRAMMGMPSHEVAHAEGMAAQDWLRHVEAGRISVK